ncbi:MAG: class I SAM-dependent methyltransferase [Candidatus Thermoplasmatota archaeon]|nr:class I SAM-dependent methyltransferase [Candidatus Thermoplasmatota archaeon]
MTKKAHRFEASDNFAEHLESEHRRGLIPVESVLPRMPLGHDDSVLDLGAGVGYFTFPMARLCQEVIAVDIEPKMLSLLRSRISEREVPNVSPVKGEITRLPFDAACVDHVFAAFVYHEVDSQEQLMRECHRVLRPSGSLTVIDFQKRLMTDGPPIWVRKKPEHVLSTGAGVFRLEDRFETKAYYQLRLRKT